MKRSLAVLCITLSLIFAVFSAGAAYINLADPGGSISTVASSDACEYVFDPDELQYAYNDIIDGILSEMKSNITSESALEFYISMSHGSIFDFFDKGVNQMVIAYTPDGVFLKAGIYILNEDFVLKSFTADVAPLAGGATCEIIPGYFEDTETIFVLYKNYDSDKIIGELKGYDVSGDEIECIYSQTFNGTDELKKISETDNVSLGATACSFSETGLGKVINTMQVS